MLSSLPSPSWEGAGFAASAGLFSSGLIEIGAGRAGPISERVVNPAAPRPIPAILLFFFEKN